MSTTPDDPLTRGPVSAEIVRGFQDIAEELQDKLKAAQREISIMRHGRDEVMSERDAAVAELVRVRDENRELRLAVIHVADAVLSVRNQVGAIRAIRNAANHTGKPFRLADLDDPDTGP